MANEFIARKGLIVSGSTVVTNAVTASFFSGNGSALTNVTTTSASFASTAPYSGLTGVPSGIVSGSTASSPSQGTVRVTINGVNTDVDTGLQTSDSPTFAGLAVDTNTLYVDAVNNRVGVGTASPADRLVVENTAANVTARISAGGSATYTATLAMGTTTRDWSMVVGGAATSYRLSLNYAGTDAPLSNIFVATKEGNVGIGVTAPLARLHVFGGGFALSSITALGSTPAAGTNKLTLGGNLANGVGNEIGWYPNSSFDGDIAQVTALATAYGSTSAGALIFRTNAGSQTTPGERWRITSDGHFLAGADNTYDIGASGATRPRDLFLGRNATVAGNLAVDTNTLFVDAANNRVGVGTASPTRTLTVNGSANITGSLDVTGAFTAQTKSFKINHQTIPNRSLVYGVLEGPEHAVYCRGKLVNTNTITLPDEWEWLVDIDSITVQLTSIGSHQPLYVQEVNGLTITVGSDMPVNCYYIVHATRNDVEPLQTVE